MANSNLLKEAIADAKAVRETAIANAKIALEEAFTPRLQSILSQKLQQEIEGEDEKHEEEVEEEMHSEVDDSEEEDLDEEIDLEEILKEMGYGSEEEVSEGEDSEEEKEEVEENNELEETKAELSEAISTIKELKSTINEVNLLNAKLLYTNKLFRAYELNNDQKHKVVETLDRTKNVREVKLVFSTLAESFKIGGTSKKQKQAKINESFASKPVASTAPKKEVIAESTNTMADRFKKLANII
jgi:hypothetical protein